MATIKTFGVPITDKHAHLISFVEEEAELQDRTIAAQVRHLIEKAYRESQVKENSNN